MARPRDMAGRYLTPSYSPAGNAADDLYTTIDDYATFVLAVMTGSGLPAPVAATRDSIHVLDPTAVCDPDVLSMCPDRVGWGLGWYIIEYPDRTIRQHTGSDRGEKTIAAYVPERGEGAIVLTNGAYGFNVYSDVLDLLLGRPAFVEYLRSQACREARDAGVILEQCRSVDQNPPAL